MVQLNYWRLRIPYLNWLEDNFNYQASLNFSLHYWTAFIPVSFLYLVFVYLGNQYMKNKTPFNLRTSLMLWSGLLSIFSLLGALNVIPEAFQTFQRSGFVGLVCDATTLRKNQQVHFWVSAFCWSKLLELIDTVFIVLRKQKLTYLHSVHHAITLLFTFFAYGENGAIMRLPTVMNYSIHFIMYSYYALRAVRVRIPQYINICITTAQILQMIVGAIAIGTSLVLRLKRGSDHCSISISSGFAGISIYICFFILFANFFIKTYFKKNVPKLNEKVHEPKAQ